MSWRQFFRLSLNGLGWSKKKDFALLLRIVTQPTNDIGHLLTQKMRQRRKKERMKKL